MPGLTLRHQYPPGAAVQSESSRAVWLGPPTLSERQRFPLQTVTFCLPGRLPGHFSREPGLLAAIPPASDAIPGLPSARRGSRSVARATPVEPGGDWYACEQDDERPEKRGLHGMLHRPGIDLRRG